MANNTFKISLILILSFFFLQSFPQKKKSDKDFSDDFSIFLVQLDDFMNLTKNPKSKKSYKSFSDISSSFSNQETELVISISKKMRDKRLRVQPYFNDFLNSLVVVKSSCDDSGIIDWLNVIDNMVNNSTPKKIITFFDFTIKFINNQILRSTKAAKWSVSNSQCYFSFDFNEPFVSFSNPVNLICSNRNGDFLIYSTKGNYYPLSNKWVGGDGIIDWTNHGFSSDSVFAQISNYQIDTRKSMFFADSVLFFNKKIFTKPIIGKVVNKLVSGNQKRNYPNFKSYSKNIEIKEIFPNIDYRGGYRLVGKDFIADGGDYAEARIVFKRNGKDVFIANANKFNLTSDRILSESAGVKIFIEEDSIYHSYLKFKYLDSKRQLQLYRKKNGPSGAPMLNTYHNLTIDFELLEWDVDQDIITFGSLPQTDTSFVRFESIDMYLQSRFDMIQGIDAIHPLILIDKYVKQKKERKFYVEDFAKFARFPIPQIKAQLIRLASFGFVFYDFAEDRVSVLPMLDNYVESASGFGDYDVIAFNSFAFETNKGSMINNHLVNAILNVSSGDLIISGIYDVELSKVRDIEILPNRGIVNVQKNRNFIFDGKMKAGGGRLNLFGRNFHFDYERFSVDLKNIDSIQLSVPVASKINKNKYTLKTLNTVLEYIDDAVAHSKGEIRLDHPSNKSGLRKDSFPEFPIFNSFQRSFAYYDHNKSRYNQEYKRDKFYFHLDPYQIDSIDSYKADGLFFTGYLESSGIFPRINDTLRVQDDLSLGFNTFTPDSGLPLYGGKAKYYNEISLSNQGLKGEGSFEFHNSYAKANILFLPDSTNLVTSSFKISEVTSGIEFPEVYNTETYATYYKLDDQLDVRMKDQPFDFYNSNATFYGNLFMKPAELTGEGIMKLEKVEVSADVFKYNANWFDSENSSLQFFDNQGNIAVTADNLRSHIDLEMRDAVFYSNNSDNSKFNFPANQYICRKFNNCTWNMDKEYFKISIEDSIKGFAEFISTHKDQESLNFFAKSANYSLTDYIINAQGVESIHIADAIIYPDSGLLNVQKDAVISTLSSATVELTKYNHIFSNSTVDILSKNSYNATGTFLLSYGLNNTKELFFEKILVNNDNITEAYGQLDSDRPFSIHSKLDLKGKVELFGNEKDLTFNGHFMLNHNCSLLDKEWVRFRSKIDPLNIQLVLDNNLVNENEDKLFSGIMMRRDTLGLYATFFNKKKNSFDVEVIKSSYLLAFNNSESSFTIQGKDSLSNSVVLYENTCQVKAEGDIDLNLNLGRIKVKTIGMIQHELKSNKTNIDGYVLLDFYFSEQAMKAFSLDISGGAQDGVGFEEYDDLYVRNLKRLIGNIEKANEFRNELVEYKIKSFPKEFSAYTLAFTDISLIWDNKNKSFVSNGNIGLGNSYSNPINEIIPKGLLVFEKQKGKVEDKMYMKLQTYDDEEYYFSYERNSLWVRSASNEEFNSSIEVLSDSKRRLEGKPKYYYKIMTEQNAKTFNKKIAKKY